jgi:glycosyltransferase involved in cell wall biosynthesis
MTSSILPQFSIPQGGLWTKGIFKEGTDDQPLITIITVVLNGQNSIRNTIENILHQTYPNIELIVIDGGSKDQTVEIIQSLDSKIDHWISEKDSGIYHAMNKGINLARGKWLNFMNSGDIFFSNQVVEKLFSGRDFGSTLIIHGNWEVRYGVSKKRIAISGNSNDLWKGSQFCHQAVFINTAYHKSNPYLANSKIVGDFEFFYKAWKAGETFLKTSDTVASIESGGVSDMKRMEVLKSWKSIIDKDLKSSFYFLYRYSREFLISRIKKISS